MHLPAQVRNELLAQYFSILASGYAVYAAQLPRPKRRDAKNRPVQNLLDACCTERSRCSVS